MKITPLAGQTAISAYKTQLTISRINEFTQSTDQVSLSAEVISFSSIISKIKEAMDIRTPEELARIDEIDSLIRSGSYYVASYQVAAKIVEDYL
jgi:anti-sigma28 factor (negative regulator of flagellin synthesis)